MKNLSVEEQRTISGGTSYCLSISGYGQSWTESYGNIISAEGARALYRAQGYKVSVWKEN